MSHVRHAPHKKTLMAYKKSFLVKISTFHLDSPIMILRMGEYSLKKKTLQSLMLFK